MTTSNYSDALAHPAEIRLFKDEIHSGMWTVVVLTHSDTNI